MASEQSVLAATVVAEVPWYQDTEIQGTLRLEGENLVLTPDGTGVSSLDLPLSAVTASSLETAYGVLPALLVWHEAGGRRCRSRFVFQSGGEQDQASDLSGLAERLGPGAARDAAERLESGFRFLSGGLQRGKRTARQAVEGIARREEYRQWPEAIEAARARARSASSPASTSSPEAAGSVLPEVLDPPTGSDAYAWFLRHLPVWLENLGQRARELGTRGIPVLQPLYPLDSPTCRIVLVGEFSRGKSTMINALFGIHGEIALPTGMTPTTALACAIRVPHVGETDGATIAYRTNRPPLELSLDQFRRNVRLAEDAPSETAASLHLDEARRVVVRSTGAYLPSGVEIEDTPGLNEEGARSAGALSALGRADLVLFVLAADQLLGALEREVIERQLIDEHQRNVLFLVNFWDGIEGDDQRRVLRQRAENLLRPFPSPFRQGQGPTDSLPDVVYVSALQAARAQRQGQPAPEASGIPGLRARLRELLGPGWQDLLLRARAGRALRFTRLLRLAVSRSAAPSQRTPSPGPGTRGPAGEAAVPARRHAATLAEALRGATARLQDSLEQGKEPTLRTALGQLDAAANLETEAAQREQGRLALANLRRTAGEYGVAAQQAVELVTARCRAAFLEHGQPPPDLDLHYEPLLLTMQSGSTLPALRALAGDLPRLLAEDRGVKSALLVAELNRRLGTIDHPAAGARDDAGGERLQALRSLEGELIRLEAMLARLVDRA